MKKQRLREDVECCSRTHTGLVYEDSSNSCSAVLSVLQHTEKTVFTNFFEGLHPIFCMCVCVCICAHAQGGAKVVHMENNAIINKSYKNKLCLYSYNCKPTSALLCICVYEFTYMYIYKTHACPLHIYTYRNVCNTYYIFYT